MDANEPNEPIESDEVAAPRTKEGKRRLVIIALVVLVCLLGGGFFLVPKKASPTGKAATADAARTEPAAKAYYLPLNPAFVVNFQDDRATRFLQVGVSLMAHDPDALTSAEDAGPAIRNALVLLFSSQTYETLNKPAGKLELQKQALAAVRKTLPKEPADKGIQAVYFTSFVMQ